MKVVTCGFIKLDDAGFVPIYGLPETGEAVVMHDTMGPSLVSELTLVRPMSTKEAAASRICEKLGVQGVIFDDATLITLNNNVGIVHDTGNGLKEKHKFFYDLDTSYSIDEDDIELVLE